MKIHDLKPRAGLERRPSAASAAASAARAARPPAAAPRARAPAAPSRRASRAARRRCTAGPEGKGFKNPFRVEYQVVNLDTLEASRPRPRSTPTTLRATGLVAQARPGQGPRPGRAQPAPSRSGPTRFSKSAEAAIEAAGGTVEILPAAVGRPPSAGQGQRTHQPLDRRPARPARRRGAHAVLSRLRNMFRVADLRNKILFTLFMIALYRLGAHLPVPGVDFERDQAAAGAGRATAASLGFLDLFSGGAITHFAVFALGIMPYITASIIMQLLGGGDPEARAVAAGGRRSARRRSPSGPATSPSASRSCSRPASPSLFQQGRRLGFAGGNPHEHRPHRRQLQRRARRCSSCSRWTAGTALRHVARRARSPSGASATACRS